MVPAASVFPRFNVQRPKRGGIPHACLLISVLIACMVVVAMGACSGGAAHKGPVYLMKRATTYYSNGDPLSVMARTYDESGNLLTRTNSFEKTKYSDGSKNTTTFGEYDAAGCNGTWASDTGDKGTVSWEYSGNLPTKTVNNETGEETTYEYYSDGRMKSQVSILGTRRTTAAWDYDKHTYDTETVGGEYPEESHWTWETDDKGNIVAYSCTTSSTYTEGKRETYNYKTQCDENGNIVTVWKDGALWATLEYDKIDNPNLMAWVSSNKPVFV